MDRTNLLSLLERIGNRLEKKITLVAVGGTAMTLLGLKNSTIDIDFTGPVSDIEIFKEIEATIPHGFRIDTWTCGDVHISQLPADYLEKSITITQDIKQILLKSLNPVDIVVSKIGRLEGRDIQDIEICIQICEISLDDIRSRAEEVIELYPANEKVYRIHLEQILTGCF